MVHSILSFLYIQVFPFNIYFKWISFRIYVRHFLFVMLINYDFLDYPIFMILFDQPFNFFDIMQICFSTE
eukprot:UN03145